MISVNLIIYSSMLAKMHNLKHVVWIGVHIDLLEYMQMSEVRNDFYLKELMIYFIVRLKVSSKGQIRANFP